MGHHRSRHLESSHHPGRKGLIGPLQDQLDSLNARKGTAPASATPRESDYARVARALTEMQRGARAAAARNSGTDFDSCFKGHTYLNAGTSKERRETFTSDHDNAMIGNDVDVGGMHSGAASADQTSQHPGMPSGNFDAHIGEHAGMGPRRIAIGPECSDERLVAAIRERFLANPQIETHAINVTVSDRVVTLEGTVPDQRTLFAAEDLADDTWGVYQVLNRLRVDNENKEKGASNTVFPDSLQ